MRRYPVSKLKGNEILAQSVYSENGQLLLEAGMVWNPSYKEYLDTLDIKEVFICNRYEKYEKPNFCLKEKEIIKFQQELEEILSHHVYKDNGKLKEIKALAEKITEKVSHIENNKAVDIPERTENLYEHVIYTTIWCLILGKEIGLSLKEMENLALGSLLHDIGLCYINIDFWNCHIEKMTPKEIFELKKHTILAYTALEKELWIPEISKKMILFHHEKLDKSGYPLKQKNKETECRIIQICDSIDGIICGIEREKGTLYEALEEISDTEKYDAAMAEILKKKIAKYPVGTRLQLKSGKTAVVAEQTENPFQPEIILPEEENTCRHLLMEEVTGVF